MTDTIISSNISNLTLNHKMVLLTTNSGEIIFDISKAFKSNDIFINITKVTSYYKKEFSKWVRLKSTQNFIRAMEKETSPDVGRLENSDKIGKIEAFTSPLIKRKAGRYGGTYIHENILLDYLMWLDIDLKVRVHLFLKSLLKQITVTKLNRADTKLTFKPLTNMIANKYLPYHVGSIRYNRYPNLAYSDLLDLINVKVLGKTAKQFRALYNIPDKKSIYTRDYLTALQLKNIRKFQQALYNILEMDILELEDIKKMIDKMSLITEDNQHNFI